MRKNLHLQKEEEEGEEELFRFVSLSINFAKIAFLLIILYLNCCFCMF